MPVSLERDGPVAVISVDDGKANAYSPDVLTAIGESLNQVEVDGTAAIVLQGRPGYFSAGFELSVMRSGAAAMRALVTQGAELLLAVFTFPAPIVLACTGHALAAGAAMLLVGDVRIGAEGDFKIGLNEVALATRLPILAVELARYRMPPAAFDSVLLGEVFPPAAAVGAGYLDRTSTSVLDDALATAHRLSRLQKSPFAETKKAARGSVVQHIRHTLTADVAALDPATG